MLLPTTRSNRSEFDSPRLYMPDLERYLSVSCDIREVLLDSLAHQWRACNWISVLFSRNQRREGRVYAISFSEKLHNEAPAASPLQLCVA